MGGAQPLAATFAGAVSLTIECQQRRIDFRLRSRYLDEQAASLDDALARVAGCTAATGSAFDRPARQRRRDPARAGRARGGIRPDLVTDQTRAHDLINGYLPPGWSVERWHAAQADPAQHADLRAAAAAGCAVHVQAMLAFQQMGVPTVDYGNNIRQVAFDAGVRNAFDIPGFVPAYIRPLFCRGVGPFRWVALSGDPEDIRKTDAKMKELFPDDTHLHRWLDMAGERIAFQGLPARICWIGLGDRHRAGLAFNEMVGSGELKAPIVIGRDHLDSGSVASPNRETEAMQDGSDAVSDWPLLNALLNTASGATWVSFHHGGGVGMGYSQHAGVVIVCDGSDAAATRLERVLWNDPGTGVMRHADAGYADRPRLRAAAGTEPADGGSLMLAAARGRSRSTSCRPCMPAAGSCGWTRTRMPAIIASADVVRRAAEGRRRGLRRQHGLRQTGEHTHQRSRPRDAAAESDPLAQRRASGAPLAPPVVRLMLATKAASLARGHSGVRPAVIDSLLAVHNAGLVPYVPSQG